MVLGDRMASCKMSIISTALCYVTNQIKNSRKISRSCISKGNSKYIAFEIPVALAEEILSSTFFKLYHNSGFFWNAFSLALKCALC